MGVLCRFSSLNWRLLLLLLSEPGGQRCGEGSRQAPAPGGSSSPLDWFLAISPSHIHRHLLRSRLSEVLTTGTVAVGRNTSISCDLQQYGLPKVDGLIES